MASFIFGLLNTFVPFADPARPLWRDIVLSAVLCTVLYVAPRIDFDEVKSRLFVGRDRTTSPVPAAEAEHEHDHPENLLEEEQDIDDLRNSATDVREDPEPRVDTEQERPILQEPIVDEEHAAVPTLHQPRPRDPNREVGAKKAKSIARRNQQRAYNEFLREQGDAQRAEWARDGQQREEELAAERQRRAAVDATFREKERAEREARKAKEEAGRKEELEAAQTAVGIIEERLAEKKLCSITDVARAVKRTDGWVRQLVTREGLLGVKTNGENRTAVILTKSGWIVRVNNNLMDKVYAEMAASCNHGEGKVTWNEMGRIVQQYVLSVG